MTAKKKGRGKSAPKLPDRLQVFEGDILQGLYDENHIDKMGLLSATVRRKARYYCFKLRHAVVNDREPKAKIPEGFQEFVEQLPGFAGWKNFAKTWDLSGTNPFMIVLRLRSVWQEWDYVMERVAIPIDSPPEQINARMEQLASEYAKNNR